MVVVKSVLFELILIKLVYIMGIVLVCFKNGGCVEVGYYFMKDIFCDYIFLLCKIFFEIELIIEWNGAVVLFLDYFC